MIEIIKRAVQSIMENEEISQGKEVRFFISDVPLSFEPVNEKNSEEDSTYVDVVIYEYPDAKKWEIQFSGISYHPLMSGNIFNTVRNKNSDVTGVVETIIEGIPALTYTINSK